MLTIRLQRAGKANRPQFRIVLAEKTAAADKKFVEVLGHYNPRTKDFGVKEDRVNYWISQHVTLSPTVHNLFVTKSVMQAPKVKAFSVPKKPAEPAAEPAAPAAAAEAPTAEVLAPETQTITPPSAPEPEPETASEKNKRCL